jgi:hypothetical protein
MMESFIRVLSFADDIEKNEWFEDFNKQTAVYYKKIFEEFCSMAKNDIQKHIFTDWWHGECVSTEKYKSKYSKQDNDEAHSLILHAISMGFG